MAPFDIREVRELMEGDELELEKIGDRKTALFCMNVTDSSVQTDLHHEKWYSKHRKISYGLPSKMPQPFPAARKIFRNYFSKNIMSS